MAAGLLLLFLALGSAVPLVARAQATAEGIAPESPWTRDTFGGEWGGFRDALGQHGIRFDLWATGFYQGMFEGTGKDDWDFGGRADLMINGDTGSSASGRAEACMPTSPIAAETCRAFVAPPSGVVPPVIMGGILTRSFAPYALTAMVFDPNDQTTDYSIDGLFADGVNVSLGLSWSGERNDVAGRSAGAPRVLTDLTAKREDPKGAAGHGPEDPRNRAMTENRLTPY